MDATLYNKFQRKWDARLEDIPWVKIKDLPLETQNHIAKVIEESERQLKVSLHDYYGKPIREHPLVRRRNEIITEESVFKQD